MESVNKKAKEKHRALVLKEVGTNGDLRSF